MRALAAGVLAAFADLDVVAFAEQAEEFLRAARHPTLDRGYLECAYTPMVELLGYLAANGFTTYMVSGGGRDFVRPVSAELYGIPTLRLLVLHDDAEREFQYVAGAEKALERAEPERWTVVSMKDDWRTVF